MIVPGPCKTHQRTAIDQPIQSIRVLHSGAAQQHKEHRYGSAMPRLYWVFFGRSWVSIPIQFFLIEHSNGPILFDTGLDPAIVADPLYIKQKIGRYLLPKIFRFDVHQEDRIDHVLRKSGVAASDIRAAVISHLHFDHAGGIAQIPQAELLVSAREWSILSEPHPEREWVLREHIELPSAKWTHIAFVPTDDPLLHEFDGVFDLANDGSIVLLPTPGHTPGSISMLIRQDGWDPILLVGDLTYEPELLENDVVAGVGDPATLRATFGKVRRLRECLPSLKIVASHDFSARELIARATGLNFS